MTGPEDLYDDAIDDLADDDTEALTRDEYLELRDDD